MKKMTKLLSVILAFVMALSCMTMMASAAKTSYKTVADLDGLKAYSPYGTVTRLTTEERLSILVDSLDILLAKVNINMGWQGLNLGFIKIQVLIDFTSVDQALASLDSFYDKKGYFNLIGGTIGKLNMDNWQKGMSRDGTAHEVIVNNILKLLSDNTALVENVFDSGISLGLLKSFVKVNLNGINGLVTDLPGALKGVIYPMFGRQDDTQKERDKYKNKSSDLITLANDFVKGLFTKPMSWTSYRVDESGSDLGYTLPLPTDNTYSRYFVDNGDGTMTQYDYQYAGLMGSPVGGNWVKTVTYTKAKEFDSDNCTTYVYRAPEGYSGDQTLKWYKAENVVDANGNKQSGYWLPSVKEAFESGALSINLNGTDSLASLLYSFIPYIFAEMAPTVLNGSAKKLIAEAFDVTFEEIGKKDSPEVEAVAKATGNPDNFFTKDQEYYTWEYTDYIVVEDDSYYGSTPYYRYQDKFFKGTVPSNISAYYEMFNWDWNISGDFLNAFIPGNAKNTDGYAYMLDGLNDLIGKAIDEMIKETWVYKDKEYSREDVFTWEKGNGQLLNNIMETAREFFKIAPEEILDEYYMDGQFAEVMMETGTLNQAVNGLICEAVKLLMPQIKFPDNIIDQPMTAIAAVVVRELCTQLMPTYNFDAMIYDNYGDTSKAERALLTHTADEWLDITLYMGVNLGMYYLRNLADIGEDSDSGYYSVMATLGALPTANADAQTFTATSYKTKDAASWLVMVDWIVDWALDTNTEWCWHFGRLVDVEGAVSLTTYENPFNKINKVILTFIPELENLLNTDGLKGDTYGSNTWLEKVLKGGLVDSIVSLNVPQLIGMLHIPDASVLRKGNMADTLVKLIVTLLNGITKKVCGGKELIDSSKINSVANLLNQTNIKTVVSSLVGKLYAASNTYKLLDPILPLANFFIGWTTDPQKYADPILSLSNTDGHDYLLASGGKATTTLTIVNNCSGMLLKHRNSDVTDHAYDIKILGVESSTGEKLTLSKTVSSSSPITIAPYDQETIDITVPYTTDKMVDITVYYQYVGKDGEPLGGTQSESVYKFISATDKLDSDSGETTGKGTSVGGVWGIGGTTPAEVKHWGYQKYNLVSSLADVEDISVIFENLTSKTAWVYSIQASGDTSPIFGIDTSVAHGQTENATLKANYIGFMESKSDDEHKTWSANVYTLTNREYVPVSGEEFKVGFTIAFINGDNGKDLEKNKAYLNVSTTIYYYDVSGLEPLVHGSALYAKNYDLSSAEAKAAWAEYLEALATAAYLVDGPKRHDQFKSLYTAENIASVQERLESAIEAMDKYASSSASSTGDVSKVKNKLAELETNPDRDINFQDYKLFEYFKYENERTAARAMVKSTEGPVEPEKYIGSVWGNDLVNKIIEVQTKKALKIGVPATVTEPTDEEWEAYYNASGAFNPATYTDVAVENQVAMLQYYYNFMKANAKGAPDKTFLNKEIAYAEGQKYDQAVYSDDSWTRYTAALENAQKVAKDGSALESEVFDAKYELMVAQNKLLEKSKSMKHDVYMDEELIPLITLANTIIDQYGYYEVDTSKGRSEKEALAALVSALGLEYKVNVDGKDYEGILYDRSAITFTAYDRLNTVKNKRAVDAAADKLREAISYFKCEAKIVEADSDLDIYVDHDVRLVAGINPNSIVEEQNLRDRVELKAKEGTELAISTSKAGFYGTGTRLDIVDGETILATYFIVIFGDVNGDGAVDAFDAIEVDHAYHDGTYHMGDIYDDAADIDHNGVVDSSDYAAIVAGVQCTGSISQDIKPE